MRLHEDEIRSVERSEVDAALIDASYPGSMLDLSDLDSPEPLRRDLAYLRLLAELLGPEWVERPPSTRSGRIMASDGLKIRRPQRRAGLPPRLRRTSSNLATAKRSNSTVPKRSISLGLLSRACEACWATRLKGLL
jgi:hypothetical protein